LPVDHGQVRQNRGDARMFRAVPRLEDIQCLPKRAAASSF
jgi:hypothetical protein